MKRVVLGLVSALVLSATTLLPAEDAPKPVPTTTDDVKVTVKELDLLIEPLTLAELTVEANAWQAVLAAKVKELNAVVRQSGKASGDALSKLKEQEAALRDERTAITDRLNAVLASIKAKGGKVEDYEKYIAAVSGVRIDVTDAGGAWLTVLNWLKSPEGGLRYGKNILLFIVTLLVFKFLAIIVGKITAKTITSFRGTSALLRDFFVNTSRKVTFFIGFVIALSMLEVDIGPFLAAMGVIGFVVGFALQGTMSNFASGVMLLLYRPYDIGDTISVGAVKGRVDSMSLVATTVINPENQTVVVPNGSIWGGVITNISKTVGGAQPATAK